MKQAADTYDAMERWADSRTTDLERFANHPDPELCEMLGGFRKELIAEINPRRSLRRDGNRLSSREIAVGWDPEAWAPTPAARNVITTPILIAHGDHRTRNATAQDSPRIP